MGSRTLHCSAIRLRGSKNPSGHDPCDRSIDPGEHGEGRLQEVRGAGVVGEEPVIGPGESFTYTSGCPLTTPHGTMSGEYHMETREGGSFPVTIPAFALESPNAKRVVH